MSIIGVLIFWSASVDPTVNQYKIYAGTAPGNYNLSNSPLTVGNVLHYYYPVPGPGRYYFAISAVSSVTGETIKGTEFIVDVLEPVGRIEFLNKRQLVS